MKNLNLRLWHITFTLFAIYILILGWNKYQISLQTWSIKDYNYTLAKRGLMVNFYFLASLRREKLYVSLFKIFHFY